MASCGWRWAKSLAFPVTADLLERCQTLSNPSGLPLAPARLDALCGAKMKGFTLLHLMDLMDSEHPDGARAWLQTLPPSLLPALDRRLLTSVSWVPMDVYYVGVRWLAERGSEGAKGALRIGHQLASRDINAFFRFIFSMASAPTVMSLGGRFWRSYFDRSALHVLTSSHRDVTGEVRDWPLLDDVSLYELQGSLVAWIEASRAKNMRVTRFEVVSRAVVAFAAEWE